MFAESDYLTHIQHTFPDLDIQDVQVNREGMVNVIVIVNRARGFRFPRPPWGVKLLRQEAKALDWVRKYVDLPEICSLWMRPGCANSLLGDWQLDPAVHP